MVGIMALVYLLGVSMYLVGALYLVLSLCSHQRRWRYLPMVIAYATIWFCVWVPACLRGYARAS